MTKPVKMTKKERKDAQDVMEIGFTFGVIGAIGSIALTSYILGSWIPVILTFFFVAVVGFGVSVCTYREIKADDETQKAENDLKDSFRDAKEGIRGSD